MTVAAVMLVRDEADVLPYTLDYLATQVDEILVYDNGSTDGTRDVLADRTFTHNLAWFDDPEPGHFQSRKTTDLAMLALEQGHSWVVPVDADEVWYSPHHPSVASALRELSPRYNFAAAELYDHFETGDDPADEPNPLRRLGWRKTKPSVLPKVACRADPTLVIADGNHGAEVDGPITVAERYLAIRHFPYRGADHFVRKAVRGAKALALTDLPADVGGHWRGYGGMIAEHGSQAGIDWYRRYFYFPLPELDPELIYDPAPIGGGADDADRTPVG